MEKLELKRAITLTCKMTKLEALENLGKEIKDYQESSNEYGQARDRYDSFREQLANKRDMLVLQYQKTQEAINLLNAIDLSREYEKAGFGSVVITPDQNVFIAIGLGKIILDDGTSVYAISSTVPFAKLVKELKKGDKFKFNGQESEILDIF